MTHAFPQNPDFLLGSTPAELQSGKNRIRSFVAYEGLKGLGYAVGFEAAAVHSWLPNAPTNFHSGFSGTASATPEAAKTCPHPVHFPDAMFPSL